MATYMEAFRLPIDEEASLIARRMAENGGCYGYIDNAYPCEIFGPKGLREINADRSGGQGVKVRLTGMENFGEFRANALARDKSVSRRKYLQRIVGREVRMGSNGETALSYFEAKLKNDTLYCLDEPENSMSPKMQLELKEMLEEMTRYCGCQLIIATHSPFLLSLDGALIYDLDAAPVDIKDWWELENARIYFDFFMRHEALFRR